MVYRETPAVRARQADTRARLVAAAAGLVAEGGYAGASMAAVAQAAGVGTGTLYRHFPNKGTLFAEVFRVACAREVAAATADAKQRTLEGGSHVDAVVTAVTVFARRALLSGRLAYALLCEPVDLLVDAERLVFRESYRDLLAVQIRAAVDAGEIPDQDATISAAGIVGAIGEALVMPLTRGDADPHVLSAMTLFVRRCLGGT